MDYAVEGGAKANFVPYKDEEKQRQEQLDAREARDTSETPPALSLPSGTALRWAWR